MKNTNRTTSAYENKGMNGSYNTKTLWVGDLDKIKDEVVDENYIVYCMFYEFSEDIIKIKLCKEKNSQKNSYAFIEFSNFEIAKYCFDNLNGKWIPGKIHKFKLNWAKYNITDNINSNEKNIDVELDDKGTYSIYVGSLPKSTTKEEIESLFSNFYNSICFVKMIKNTQKNHNKIYCFIHFFNYEECIRALAEMDGYVFKGYKIKVSKSHGIKGNNNSEVNNYDYISKNYEVQFNNLKSMNMNNYNKDNYNRDNYITNNYNADNYNADNYNADNYNADNYNADNYNADNYNADNYNADNYNANNYNKEGYIPSIYHVNNNKMMNNLTDKEENNNCDPNKNCYFYYSNVNNKLNNPYDINYYDHINSNITSYPGYTTNTNSTHSYNANNYSNPINHLNYYTSQMIQINNYTGTDVNPVNTYTGDISLMNNYTGDTAHMNNYTNEMNYVNNYNICSSNNVKQLPINYKMNSGNYVSDIINDNSGNNGKNILLDDKKKTDNINISDVSTEEKINSTKQDEINEKDVNTSNDSCELHFYNLQSSNNEYNNYSSLQRKNSDIQEINYSDNIRICAKNYNKNDPNNNYYYYDADTNKNDNKDKNNIRNHSNTNNSTNNDSIDNNDTIDNDQSVHNNDTIDNDHSISNSGSVDGHSNNNSNVNSDSSNGNRTDSSKSNANNSNGNGNSNNNMDSNSNGNKV
ncbi:polyadenylate-binding protein 3 [Plasmodium brasilianum]|nr:RNA-binding protein, putative [Plasmodium malariae]KAI4837207.1 polyadenylate-binding protein 3 [Plasmodium brasilianum]SCO93091.1 RNA-binding protein, putative [Plasmodium malariae]